MRGTRNRWWLAAGLVAVSLWPGVAVAGNVTGTVAFAGKAPALKPLAMDAEPVCHKKHGGKPAPNEALVLGARPVSRHGASSRAGVELEPAPGRRGQRSGTCRTASGLAPRVCRRDTTRRRRRLPAHGDGPRRPYRGGTSQRARVSGAAWRPGRLCRSPVAPARAGGPDAHGARTMNGRRARRSPRRAWFRRNWLASEG